MRRVRFADKQQLSHYMRVGDLVVFSGLWSKKPKRGGVVVSLGPVRITWGGKGIIDFKHVIKWKLSRQVFVYHLKNNLSHKIQEPCYFLEDDKFLGDAELIDIVWRTNEIITSDHKFSIKNITSLPIFRDIYFELKAKKVDTVKQF